MPITPDDDRDDDSDANEATLIDTVREHPLQALLLAGAIGFVLARLAF